MVLLAAVASRPGAPRRSPRPRSRVATATEIHDHLRVLFARIGRTVCDSCGTQVTKDTAESAVERLLGLPEGTRVLIGFPLSVGGTPLPDLFDRLQKRGFGRLLVGSDVVSLESLASGGLDPLVVLVDRVAGGPDARSRLTDSLETAFAEG